MKDEVALDLPFFACVVGFVLVGDMRFVSRVSRLVLVADTVFLGIFILYPSAFILRLGALVQGIAALAVKVVQVLSLDWVVTGFADALQQRYDLRVRNLFARVSRLKATTPMIRTECFRMTTWPNLYAAIADHLEL